MSEAHLWLTKHPYYAQEGCYYSNECHVEYPSWQAFIADDRDYFDFVKSRRERGLPDPKIGDEGWYGGWVTADLDYNLLYRWDWTEDREYGETKRSLRLYFIGQRKAKPHSVYINGLKRSDEAAVRAWLWPRWCHLLRLWSPISGWPVEPKTVNCDDVQHELPQALEHVACEMAAKAAEISP